MPRAGAAAAAAVLVIIALAAALSVDVVKTGYGVKSDEATYVAMALSAAYDHDLTYERRDLERFFGLYRAGPDGIFLKRGKTLRVRLQGSPPFVRLIKSDDRQADRYYFGKALVYPLVAAPFVRLFGLNGFLVLHVLLIALALACGYAFIIQSARKASATPDAAQGVSPVPAMLFTLAFVGASCVPVYLVFLAPEILYFTLVFLAYFLWLYKEVAPPGGSRFLRGPASDVVAAILLGAATYANPRHAFLVAPPVLWLWMRRRWTSGFVVGAAAVATAAALFALNAGITGEFNYQGGDRKRFVGAFPLERGRADVWYDDQHSAQMSTNDSDAGNVLQDFPNRFGHNVEYFLIGRHFGFVPYFFPGVVAILMWLASPARRDRWRWLTALAVGASAVALVVFAPFTWSGGGGPPGNRYFMSVYAALFFVTPPILSLAPGLLAWTGGALFTAKMLVNPFVAAKFPNQTTERGFARRLPVELTMANDLPIMLEGVRAHAWYNDVLLYFLDEHAYHPETVDEKGRQGVWIAGDGRADILMRCEWPIDHLAMTVQSHVPTVFVVSAGAASRRVPLEPNKPVSFDLPASGVRDLRSYAYLLQAQSTEAFTPHLQDPSSTDLRNLGVLMRFTAVPAGGVRPPAADQK